MGKAVMVIDTPESCDKCPCFCDYYSDMNCRINHRTINYPYPKDFRQKWCPLKKMPDEEHNDLEYDEYSDGYDDGWNSFRRKILREENI